MGLICRVRVCRLTRPSSAAASEGAVGKLLKSFSHEKKGNKPARRRLQRLVRWVDVAVSIDVPPRIHRGRRRILTRREGTRHGKKLGVERHGKRTSGWEPKSTN